VSQWRATVDIPATTKGPGTARAVVSALLDGWGFADLRPDAVLVTSELVTNAYRHAPGTDSFELELMHEGAGTVRISLADGSSIRPVIRDLADDAPSGRGIRLVDALAVRWGADDHHGGKRVWVELISRVPQTSRRT
jgi:serine/threonine-protein kinase RsbW